MHRFKLASYYIPVKIVQFDVRDTNICKINIYFSC